MAGEEREERGGSVSPRPFYNLTPGDIRVPPGHGKSWNLGRPFSRPGKSWKIAKVMESHRKVMENDDSVMEYLLLH